MILVDTSVWADHFRGADGVLSGLLAQSLVTIHPFVTGELALGNLQHWSTTVAMLQALPSATVATHEEILVFIENGKLAGTGIGLIDTHLLAACRLDRQMRLWSRDKRLNRSAQTLGLAWDPSQRF